MLIRMKKSDVVAKLKAMIPAAIKEDRAAYKRDLAIARQQIVNEIAEEERVLARYRAKLARFDEEPLAVLGDCYNVKRRLWDPDQHMNVYDRHLCERRINGELAALKLLADGEKVTVNTSKPDSLAMLLLVRKEDAS